MGRKNKISLRKTSTPPKPSSASSKKNVENGLNLRAKKFPIVGIGASAGGLEAFIQLLQTLPNNTGMAFVFIQHLDPTHESMLTEFCSRYSSMPTLEVKDGLPIKPNHIYIIPPNTSMSISNGTLNLVPRKKRGDMHHPIDTFFQSLARERKNLAIGIILSGMATDGTLGLKEIRANGGFTFAQDEKTAKFGGMPHNAIQAGYVDFILPPEKIAKKLIEFASHLSVFSEKRPSSFEKEEPEEIEETIFQKIISLVYKNTGVDFTYYKPSTLLRRIHRRIAANKMKQAKDYLHALQQNPEEVNALYQDILINVTHFFRDPEVFEVFKTSLFPSLMKNRASNDPIRIWVPGCSSGEEGYSIAICLLEYLRNISKRVPIQIFATDISELVLAKARLGFYPEESMGNVSPERLREFFVKSEQGYQIIKSLREMCIFAKHDITQDPPFSHLDLISCRNLMIYLGPVLQKRLFPILHYALKQEGFLALGNSEGIASFSNLFGELDKKQKIYFKKVAPTAPSLQFMGYDAKRSKLNPSLHSSKVLAVAVNGERDLEKSVNQLLLSQYTPPAILVNEEMEILQFRGDTSPYLTFSPGRASLNLLKMARGGLFLEIRQAIRQAKKINASVRKENILLHKKEGSLYANIEVNPLKLPTLSEHHFLILFEESIKQKNPLKKTPFLKKGERREHKELKQQIQKLKEELSGAKEYQQSIVEDHEATNEEMQAAHEELNSSIEELQTTNEELETAKEELSSTNEELTTLNEELQSRNLELNRSNTDLQNVLSSVHIPIIIVDNHLKVRHFTPSAKKVLNVLPSDLGRPLEDIKPLIDLPHWINFILEVMHGSSLQEKEVKTLEGHWYSMKVRPYKNQENKNEGAILSFLDTHEIKQTLERVKIAQAYAEAIVDTVREPLIILTSGLKVKTANQAFYRVFHTAKEEAEGHFFFNLGKGQWNNPLLREILDAVLSHNKPFQDFEMSYNFPDLGRKTLILNARQFSQDLDSPLILLAIEDITEWKKAEKEISKLNQELEQRVALRTHDLEETAKEIELFNYMMSHDLRTPLNTIQSFVSLLEEKCRGKLDGEGDDYLKRIHKASERMSRILEGLTNLFYFNAIKPNEQKVDLTSLAKDLSEEYQREDLKREVKFMIAPGLIARGDEILLRAVLQNLIGNAWKFTSYTSKALIELGALSEKKEGKTVYFIRDNGAGFEMAYAHKLFQPFQRLHSAEEFNGTGIGLASTQRIIKKHGGCIWAEGAIGKGATFYFTLMD